LTEFGTNRVLNNLSCFTVSGVMQQHVCPRRSYRSVASPMPRDPPVTNTVLPLRPIMPFLSIELTKSRPLLIGISRGERQHYLPCAAFHGILDFTHL
jgi:hypothetical protein